MDDTWQKLMGIDCASEEGPSSPIFHKKKWVVFPKPLKRPGSGTLLTKCTEKKQKNKMKIVSNNSLQISDLNSTIQPKDKILKNTGTVEEDPLLIYNTTPTKNIKHKRKKIDLLNFSSRTEGSFSKKSKLDNRSGLSKDPLDIELEKNLNDLGPVTSSPSVKVTSPKSKKNNFSRENVTSKPQRKLIYSCNEEIDSSSKVQTLTVNDIVKSVIIIDEADIHSSPKKHRPTAFEVECNDFQSVTSLDNRTPKVHPKAGNGLLLSPAISDGRKCNDSFGNLMFTEIENECLTNKEVCLEPIDKKAPMTADSLASPVDTNPMNETFSNYRFTEVEKVYSHFNHKENDNDHVILPEKSAVIEIKSSCLKPNNISEKNTCFISNDKNVGPTDELISHESGVTKKIVEDESHCTLNNERNHALSRENSMDNSYFKSCSDEKDIFNSTFLSQKSCSKLETTLDKEHFLSTSKDCFDNLDIISTEEFRNNHVENDYELNVSVKENVLNRSMENAENDMLNKSVSKLNVTLTDIMQRILKKRYCNEQKPIQNQDLDGSITGNGNSSLIGLTPEITAEAESKNNNPCDQTLASIPETSGLLCPGETVFLTQEYLENVKSEYSLDRSAVYYQESFDYMISAEVKSRLSGNNCVIPLVDKESSLLDRSLSTEDRVNDDERTPDDSFIYKRYMHANLNESNPSDLNESIYVENTVKSPTDTNYFLNSCENNFSQNEFISNDSVVNCSPNVFSVSKDIKQSNNVEIRSDKFLSSCKTDISNVNSDLMSQGFLQQFDHSFQLEPGNLPSQRKEKNLNNDAIEEFNVGNKNSHENTFFPVNSQTINVSQECFNVDKPTNKDFLEDTALFTINVDRADDKICCEDESLKSKNCIESVNLKNVLSGIKFINSHGINEYKEVDTKCSPETKQIDEKPSSCLHLEIITSANCNVNNDFLDTVQSDCPVLSQKQFSATSQQKSSANYSLIKVSEKVRSIFTDDLVVSDQGTVQQCLTNSNITNSNVRSDQLDKKNLTEFPLQFNMINKNYDVLKSEFDNVKKTDINQTFKSPLPSSSKNDNFMFSTAGGKSIKASDAALAKVKSKFNEIMEGDETEDAKHNDETCINNAPKKCFPTSSKNNNMFSTTGGKNIKVSDDAIAKVKSKFNEIMEGDEIEDAETCINNAPEIFLPSSSKNNNIMFSTASGKNIKVSDDALAKVKSKFNEIMEGDEIEDAKHNAETCINNTIKKGLSSYSKPSGFMTVTPSGNSFKVLQEPSIFVESKSDKILEKHQATLGRDTEDKTDINLDAKGSLSKINQSVNFKIPRAIGISPKVSNTKIEIDNKKMFKMPSSAPSTSDSFMFSTAGGKNIGVSDIALANIKSKFKKNLEIDSAEELTIKAESNSIQLTDTPFPSSRNTNNFMFSSANGKNIKISEDALAKVKSKFGEIFDDSLTDINIIATESEKERTSFPSSSKNKNLMFSSANGKNIKISEDALAKVKSKYSEIFEDSLTDVNIVETESEKERTSFSSSNKNKNRMFSSANGKNIKISEDTLAKVKSKYSEIFDDSLTDVNIVETESEKERTSFQSSSKNKNLMFSSANGKNIKISEDTLAKVKSKYSEIFDDSLTDVNIVETESKNHADKTSFPSSSKNNNLMFSSANGKNIKISEDALAKVKSKYSEIFDDSLTDVNIVETESKSHADKTSFPSSSKNNNLMFSSANGKNIKISEDALAKVKSKYSEIFYDSLTDVNIVETESKNHADKTSLPSYSKNDAFTFSTAGGKNIKVSDAALAIAKSKFVEIMGTHDDKSDTNIEQTPKSFLPHSDLCNNFMFSSASGKNVKVSENALVKVRSKFTDILESPSTEDKTCLPCVIDSDNLLFSTAAGSDMKISDVALGEGEKNEVEINERQLLETSFSCFDKCDSFSFMNESKTIEIPAVLVDMKSKLSGTSKDDTNQIGKLICETTPESFLSSSKINEIKHENTPDNYSEIKFSTARGKHVNVSEVALLKVRSKFSEVIDSGTVESLEIEESNGYAHLCGNSPNNNLSVQTCLDPVPGKTKNNKIDGCFAQMPYNEAPSQYIDKLSISYKNDKKSKSSHSGNSTLDQPLAKKICFQPGITQKTCSNTSELSNPKQSKIPFLTFTQSISQSLIDNEVDVIERKQITNEDPNLNLKRNECLESKNLESNKCDDQFSTEDSDLTMIYEVSDSAAAFMADCTPDRSVLSSPSSFFNRKSMKPVKLLEMEFDDDDEIMAAAELDINPLSNDSTKDSLDRISFRSCSGEVLSIRSDLRKKVDEIIKQKLKKRPPSSPGLYMTLRNEGNLKTFSDNLQPFLDREQLLQLGLKEEILCINSNNAGTYEFCAESFFSYEDIFSTKGIIEVGYGFSLILSDDNKIGLSDISKCFLSHPSVDPSLVSSDWIKNHFKWIVWKLACYERCFPRHLANRCLTPENVLHQLKYRYDREIDLAQRSALKKILECDEPSSRRLIACVADIQKVESSEGESNYEIELTDGWYSIWACIDPAMKILIDKEKVKIGMKLITQAAELLNCTEGCDPLQITSSIRLKLHTNSVRCVKWDSKMGFTRHPGPIRVSLSSILKNGGLVGLTSAIIARVYPLLYMSKDTDGKTVFRNAYAEHHASNLKENDLTLKSEELFEKLFPEVEAKYKKGAMKFDKSNISKINDPELLWKIVSNESDPSEVQSLMTPEQLFKVQKFHEFMSSKIREEVQALVKKKLEELIPSQKVKCLLKVRLLDPIGSCNALLTVWNPSEDLLQLLVEKKYFDFYALNACGLRDKVLQLSSTNRTIYKEKNLLKPSEEFERKVTSIHDVVVNSVTVQFGEFDVIGTVIFVKEPEKPWGVTNVYLSDAQESFLMITFWTSLKTFGCDDALKPGSTVACINLQWRQGSGSYVVPSTYANETTYFCTNPKQEYLIKPFIEIKSAINSKGLESFIIERRRKLLTILKEREYISKTPVSRVEAPKVLKRLENLKKYGDASPLPKLSLLSSPDVHRKFRSPKSGSS